MAFDVGAGLSSAGTAVAATAGMAALESQKQELEQQKIVLADQLAGAREEKGRAFTKSEREATQGFTSGENVLNRQNSIDVANISLKGSLAQAGATVQSARIHADMLEKQLTQNAPLVQAQIAASKANTEEAQQKTAGLVIATNAAKEKEEAQKAYAAAADTKDPAQIAAASQRLAIANYSAQEVAVNATTASTLAKLAADDLNRLRVEASSAMNQAPEAQELFRSRISQAETVYNSRMNAAVAAWKAVPKLPGADTGPAPGGPTLDQLIKPIPKATPAVMSPEQTNGFINSLQP